MATAAMVGIIIMVTVLSFHAFSWRKGEEVQGQTVFQHASALLCLINTLSRDCALSITSIVRGRPWVQEEVKGTCSPHLMLSTIHTYHILRTCCREEHLLGSVHHQLHFAFIFFSALDMISSVKVKMISDEMEEEKVAKNWCFQCKDGGELIICDYTNPSEFSSSWISGFRD